MWASPRAPGSRPLRTRSRGPRAHYRFRLAPASVESSTSPAGCCSCETSGEAPRPMPLQPTSCDGACARVQPDPVAVPSRGNIDGNIQIVQSVHNRPCDHTIWTLLHDLDGSTLCVTRLRAWSGITGWRFESSSAHQKALHSGAFLFHDRRGKAVENIRGNTPKACVFSIEATGDPLWRRSLRLSPPQRAGRPLPASARHDARLRDAANDGSGTCKRRSRPKRTSRRFQRTAH
jgi:hypothetical protein